MEPNLVADALMFLASVLILLVGLASCVLWLGAALLARPARACRKRNGPAARRGSELG